MIDKEIKDIILELDSDSKLNLNGLISFMENSGVDYITQSLQKNAIGFCSLYGIYLDIDNLLRCPDFLIYFTMLHETGHHKRIVKMGKEGLLKNLSLEPVDVLLEHLLYEEAVANKYASILYFQLNKEEFPQVYKNYLNDPVNQALYRAYASQLLGKVMNDEEKYKELVKSMFI